MKLPANAGLEVAFHFGAGKSTKVGRLGLADRQTIFEYDSSFAQSGLTLHPLFGAISDRVIFPKAPRLFEGLHGVFADSLPDAWGRELLRRRASIDGVDFNSLTPLDRLALTGEGGPGALVYRPAIPLSETKAIDLDRLAADALEILAGGGTKGLDDLVRLGGSSGGARPKISVAMNARGELRPLTDPMPDGFEAWIIKFRAPGDARDAGPLEAAYADMARAAGLNVSETRLLPSRVSPGYFATKRFDRPGDRRVHMVSAAAVLEADWNLPGEYETLLKLTRRVTRDQREVEAVFRRAIFNYAALNRDDHWKQHAYLMDRNGRWSSAPSFDLTNSSGPGGEHYLSIGGNGTTISSSALAKLADAESIDRRLVSEIIDQITTAVHELVSFAKNYEMSSASLRALTKSLNAATPPRLPAIRVGVRNR